MFKIKVNNKFKVEQKEDSFIYNKSIQEFKGKIIFCTYQASDYNELVELDSIDSNVYNCSVKRVKLSDEGVILDEGIVTDATTIKDVLDEFISYFYDLIDECDGFKDYFKKITTLQSTYANIYANIHDSEIENHVKVILEISNHIGILLDVYAGNYNGFHIEGHLIETQTEKRLDSQDIKMHIPGPTIDDSDLSEYLSTVDWAELTTSIREELL